MYAVINFNMIYAHAAWAPALGGQGGRGPNLEIIWVGMAHPEFPSFWK